MVMMISKGDEVCICTVNVLMFVCVRAHCLSNSAGARVCARADCEQHSGDACVPIYTFVHRPQVSAGGTELPNFIDGAGV